MNIRIARHRTVPAQLTALALSLAVAGAAAAGGVELTFDSDLLGAPPQGLVSSGIGRDAWVKVVHDGIRGAGDLSVEFRWQSDQAQPRLVLDADPGGFPPAGTLFFDLAARDDPICGAFHVRGLTSEGREGFHFLVTADGAAALRSAGGDVPFATYIPRQWYIQRLDYDLRKGVYSIVLDCYYPSGDAKTITLNPGETLEQIVFEGEGPVPSLFGLDSVRVFGAAGDPGGAPRLGAYARTIRWETPLAGPTPAVIVYPSTMEGGWEIALTLRDGLEEKLGRRLACLSDRTVTASDTWLVRHRYLQVPMIVLGNAVDNRALYAVSTKFLCQSNHKWPGKDKFCNRSVLEPFQRDVNHILLEASTPEGLRASVASFCKRVAALKEDALSVPYFRDLGRASGEWQERPYRRTGLDLSKPVEDIKAQVLRKYGKTATIRPGGLYYYPAWDWLNGSSVEAAKYAAAVLLITLDRLGPDRFTSGHYNFDRTFKAWRICFTSGALSEETINRAEAAMVQQAAYPQDYHASGLRTHDGKRIARNADRHRISSLSNYACGTDYVLAHCRMDRMTRAMVAEYDTAYRRIARRFLDCFRSNNVTSEGGDSAVCLLNLMTLTGNMEFVRNGTLARAVDHVVTCINNFGNFTGESPYIGSYSLTDGAPGRSLSSAAAFFYGDPRYQWVYRNVKAEACRVAHENPVYNTMAEERVPDQYDGVFCLPFDDRIYRALETPDPTLHGWGSVKCAPSGLPIEQIYDRVVFRDGFDPQEAFLALMGSQLTSGHQMRHANAIIQYTDLGKVLLYTHAQLTDGWVRTVLSASNGFPAEQTFACRKKALLNTAQVAAFSSVCPNSGNTEWTRTLIHRRGHYFVALDRANALEDGAYTFTCRWRTLYPQVLADGVCTVDAGDGVALEIISADPLRQQSVHTEPDGTTRPYLLSQYRSAALQKGAGVSFKNLFYARGPQRPDTCRVRSAGDHCVMVKGQGEDWAELALIGTGTSPAAFKSLKIDADIYYATADQVVAANCRELEIMGASALTGDEGDNAVVAVTREEVGRELEAVFKGIEPPGTVVAPVDREVGFDTAWVCDELLHPATHCRVARISSKPLPGGEPLEALTDNLRRLRLLKVRQTCHWDTPGAPVEITLDLGRVRDVAEIRLVGPIADHYLRRYYYQAGDVRFAVTCSNDGFTNDTREAVNPEVEFRDQTFPYAQYTWAGRVPLFAITMGVQARYIRISAVTDKPSLSFQKLLVVGADTDRELFAELKTGDLDGDGVPELVGKTSNSEVFAVDAEGRKRWSRTFPGVITAWNPVDLETDGRAEVLAYTTEDACYALEGDGQQRWRVDFDEYSKQQAPDAWERDWSKYCLWFVTAWKPDPVTGKKEVFGYGHTTTTAIRPDLSIDSTVTGSHVDKFAVADRSVLGREVLAIGGFSFRLLESAHETMVRVAMPGKLAGNGQLPVFTAVAPVSNRLARGFMAMNVSSLLWAPAGAWENGWQQSSDVPITAYAVADLDGDGCEELVIGCKDGFLRVYRITDGEILSVVNCSSAPVTAVAALQDGRLVAASRLGVTLFDRDLRRQAYRNIQATDMVVLPRQDGELICVSDGRGRIHALTVANSLASSNGRQ